jgi:general secretion pathway protein D
MQRRCAGSCNQFYRPKGFAVAATLAATLLAACSQLAVYKDDGHDPDVLDRVRSMDLNPRFPQQVDNSDQNTRVAPKPTIFKGDNSGDSPDVSTTASIQSSAAVATPNGPGFDLNFEAAPVATVAKVVLGDMLGTGYSIDPRVQGTVSLASVKPVPKSDMLYVLENALKQNGVVLLRDASGYRLAPLGDAIGSGSIDTAAARAEPGYGLSVVTLDYISAPTLLKLLDSFATKPGMIRADPGRNILLIQGTGAERRAAIETAMSFDVDWMRGRSVGLFPIQNSSPGPIIAELEKVLDTGESGLSQNIVRFLPVARMNAILAVTTKPAMLRTAEKWIRRLDNADTTRSSVHVYHVKYGEARQMARVLNDIFLGGNSSESFDTASNQIAPRSGTATASSADRLSPNSGQASNGIAGRSQTMPGAGNGPMGSSSTSAGNPNTLLASANNRTASTMDTPGDSAGSGGPPILTGLRITADPVNNTLLIYARQEDYRLVEQTLTQVDRPQLQVAIDATVAEVTLNDNLTYGVQSYLTSQNLGLGTDKGSVLNTTATSPPSAAAGVAGVAGAAANAFLNRAFPGFNFLVGSEAQPSAILSALHNVTSVKVLSNPSLVVIDNQPATLQVGDQVPVSTGTATVLTTSNTIVNTIDYRSTGIVLRIVPRINVNGNVRLDVEQEISNVTNNANAQTLTPTLSERRVKSSISVASGQTVLLAGLISEQQQGGRSGVPILDQVPFLGDAFSTTNKAKTRTELIIFIRPQIIRDSVDAHYVAEELRTKLRGKLGVSSGVH